MKKLQKLDFKARLIFKSMCLLYCSIDAVQQHRDIPEESVPYAPPLDDQRVYEVVQDGAPDPNLFAAVHKYPRQAPVEPAPVEPDQAFDDQRAYEVVQDGAPDPNLFAAVQKHPQQAPFELAPVEPDQAFDEKPTSSAADFTQHYAVVNGPVYDELNKRF